MKNRLYLQSISNEISYEGLPVSWRDFDLESFSKEKTLFDFQQNALKNALKVLWKYYEDIADFQEGEQLEINQKRKEELYKLYKAVSSLSEKNLNYNLTEKENKRTSKLLENYYPIKDGVVLFENFINRMGFWMATGSGKTLVIVKLIAILQELIRRKQIPACDILFLSYRDDLIEHFIKYVKEYNDSQFDSSAKIEIRSLKEYDSVKRNPSLFSRMVVFYYRSDNISDEQKEKLIDFRNYENDGRWYILLDEAHKGDKDDSKRQILYSIMSRNGFLFNFSATFTDPRDFITTVFNFNLKEFIEAEYGKNVYLSEDEINAFKEKDFSPVEKQRVVLKSLILLTYIKKFANKIKEVRGDLYHNPLLLTLVNSVNVEDADLKLFFKEIERIGQGKVDKDFFEEVKNEMIQSFKVNNKIFFPEGRVFTLDEDLLREITFEDVLENVFNSKSSGNIEVLTIPGNKQEMVFKLRTSERPFALIKIGDISNWLKNQLEGYEINESFDNESVFKKINQDDSDINILMGSRTFYEGWDSNRPNIILFINIGVGSNAKKFVLQATGRGVRIEPIKNERKRLENLFLAGKIKEELFEKIKSYTLPLETLFVFGTNANNLKEIVRTLKEEGGKDREYSLSEHFKINEKAKQFPLFVPVYKKASYIFAEVEKPVKFELTKHDLELVKRYFDYFSDKRVLLVKYNMELRVLKKIEESFARPLDYYNEVGSNKVVSSPEIILSQIINHFSVLPQEFDHFEKVDRGEFIVHFKKVRFSEPEKLGDFLKKLEKVKEISAKEEEIKELQLKLFEKGLEQDLFAEPFNGVKIKYVPNHYYYPVILVNPQHKIDYLNHIIKEESEVKFIEDLDKYLAQNNNLFEEKFEWWLFSKLDEITDNVYIPWYNPETNGFERFKPDFIFWLKEKGNNNYYIVFIDPKGTEHTEAYRKIDGFIDIFEGKEFSHEGFKIRVKLFCKPKDEAYALDEYKKYWKDNIHKILEEVISSE